MFDASINIYGADPKTGFALRPFDNVGVQYGLAALKAGTITPAQFLDLNEQIGGFDQDANYVPSRSVGDAGAIKRAYQGGVTLGGGGGLASIPVFDDGAYNDERGYHYQWFHFAIRERIAKQNGNADNHVMWRGPVQAETAWPVFIQWVANFKADTSTASPHDKAVKARVGAAVDGCWMVEEGQAEDVRSRTADVQQQARLDVQRGVSLVGVHALRRRRTDRRQRAQVPADADRSEGLCLVHAGGAAAPSHDLSRRRVRLLEAGREPDARGAVGVVRTRAGEPDFRRAAAQGLELSV